jgi:OPA family glycerol-3-phosphate transporter-like MFS transporter
LFKVLLVSGVLFSTVPIAIMGYLKDGIQSWLPTFFTEVFSMDAANAILINILIPVANIVFVSVAAFLYRRVFKNEVLGSAFMFLAITLLSLPLAIFYNSSPAVSLVISAVIAGSTHGINAMFISFMPRRFETVGRAATVSGICNSCVYVGSAAASYGIAYFASRFGWFITIASWGAISLFGMLVCVFCMPKWKRFIKKEETI